jgi:hypothetical protein
MGFEPTTFCMASGWAEIPGDAVFGITEPFPVLGLDRWAEAGLPWITGD